MFVLQIHYHQHRHPPLLVAVIVDISLVLVFNPHQHCLFTVLYIYGVFCPTPAKSNRFWKKSRDDLWPEYRHWSNDNGASKMLRLLNKFCSYLIIISYEHRYIQNYRIDTFVWRIVNEQLYCIRPGPMYPVLNSTWCSLLTSPYLLLDNLQLIGGNFEKLVINILLF